MQDLIERLLCCSRNALLAQRLFFSRGAISATTGIWEMIPTQPKRWRFSAVYPPAARYDYTTVRARYMSDAHATLQRQARQGSGGYSAHSTPYVHTPFVQCICLCLQYEHDPPGLFLHGPFPRANSKTAGEMDEWTTKLRHSRHQTVGPA